MKKIVTRDVRKRKATRNRIIVGVVLVGLMVLSTAGYAFFQTDKGSDKKLKYRGLEFILEDDGLWHFNIQNYEFATAYNPRQTINVSGFMSLNLQNYAGKPLYFSYDSDARCVEEISRNIIRFTERKQLVCLSECQENLPVKNCTEQVIIINQANETLIKQEENCVYIQEAEDDILMGCDAFLFKILGI